MKRCTAHARLARLEVQQGARLRQMILPDDLSTWTDADLEAFIAAGDPAATAVMRQASDAELHALVQMNDADAHAFMQERLR